MENKKQKLKILRYIFWGKKKKTQFISAVSLAQELSKKTIITIDFLEQILLQMQDDNLIEFVANQDKKGYNYTIHITQKGYLFLLSETNKGSDIIVSIFVYIIIIGIALLFVFVVKNILGGYSG